MRPDPGSFRDPSGSVVDSAAGVFRLLSDEGLANWDAVECTGLIRRLQERGALIPTERVAAPPGLAREAPPAAVLQHERIPFVSYPFEWSFEMLRQAALLQLDVLLEALEDGVTLKDGTPYNVQWRGSEPVFIDAGSFEPARPGEPWAGYRQFCMLFLYPLMLQAHVGVPFHPWLRGALEGIAPEDMERMIRGRRRLRRDVLVHVRLHSRLARRHEGDQTVRADLDEAGFSPVVVKRVALGLRRAVERLGWKPASSWAEYHDHTVYGEEDVAAKLAFVRAVTGARRRRLAWDLGCNDGRHARIAAETTEQVLALDSDHATIDALFRELGGARNVLPLVVDVADLPGGLGWRGRERRPLSERGRPDLVLALALLHHLCIGRNVPLRAVVDWLADLGGEAVVEFVTAEDPMVLRMLDQRAAGPPSDYDPAGFERLLSRRFEVDRREVLPIGTRILYHLSPPARG